MSSELFCQEHGPYDAALGTCPYCEREKGQRPPAAAPLDEEPTGYMGAPGAYQPASSGYSDDDETILPGQVGIPPGNVLDDDETVLPARGGGRYIDEEEKTELPMRRRRLLDEPFDEDIDVTVLDREETSLMGWLIVKSSPFMRRGHVMKVKPGAIYGRNPNKADVLIDDDKVSGLHARIQIKEEQFILIDLGSANGTWVNGEEISGNRVIIQDDEIKMGDTVFVLKTLGEAQDKS
jgi:hypothetical protein